MNYIVSTYQTREGFPDTQFDKSNPEPFELASNRFEYESLRLCKKHVEAIPNSILNTTTGNGWLVTIEEM